jgi:hypothetical protein
MEAADPAATHSRFGIGFGPWVQGSLSMYQVVNVV